MMNGNQDMIYLPDVTFDELKESVEYYVNEALHRNVMIYKKKESEEYLLSFPEGIGNDTFIFLYCFLMAGGPAASRKLLGWFTGSDDMVGHNFTGEFKNSGYSTDLNKRVLITPLGDDIDDMHQYGVIEDGREIHFGMSGGFEIIENGTLSYSEPDFNIDDFKLVYTVEKKIVPQLKGGFFAKLKKMFG